MVFEGQPLRNYYRYRFAILPFTAGLIWWNQRAKHDSKNQLIEEQGKTMEPFRRYESTREHTADDGMVIGAALCGPAMYAARRNVWMQADLKLPIRI